MIKFSQKNCSSGVTDSIDRNFKVYCSKLSKHKNNLGTV